MWRGVRPGRGIGDRREALCPLVFNPARGSRVLGGELNVVTLRVEQDIDDVTWSRMLGMAVHQRLVECRPEGRLALRPGISYVLVRDGGFPVPRLQLVKSLSAMMVASADSQSCPNIRISDLPMRVTRACRRSRCHCDDGIPCCPDAGRRMVLAVIPAGTGPAKRGTNTASAPAVEDHLRPKYWEHRGV